MRVRLTVIEHQEATSALISLLMARTPIADLHPELIAGIPEGRREAARERLRARVERRGTGPGTPPIGHGGGIGLLLVDGLLMRDVLLGETVATEIVGR